MAHDRLTRTCLVIIALALTVLALKPVVPVAHASSEMKCRFDGSLEIRRIDGTVKVEMERSYGAAGSSSTHPLHVDVKQ